MAKALDAARYIVEKTGKLTALRFQKLLYYCQAWSQVWNKCPLFEDQEIEAWDGGPIVSILYGSHQSLPTVDNTTFAQGNIEALTSSQKKFIDRVLALKN